MSSDDECEEWPEGTEAKPKRVIRVRGRVRRVYRVEYDAALAAEIGAMLDDEADARVEALARAHEPTGAKTPLRRKADA